MLKIGFPRFRGRRAAGAPRTDWLPLAALAALYLLAGAIAPPVERLMGLWA